MLPLYHRLLPATLLFAALGLASLSGQMTVQETLEVAKPHGAVISPDGREVAYVVKQARLETDAIESSLQIRGVDGANPRTVAKAESIAAIDWSPDGSTVYFLAKYDGKFQIWQTRTEGEPPRKLTAEENGIAPGGLDAAVEDEPPLKLSPDGKHAIYMTRDLIAARRQLDEMFRGSFLYTGEMSPEYIARSDKYPGHLPVAAPSLWVLDLRTQVKRKIWQGKDIPAGQVPVHFQWSPDGNWLAVMNSTIVKGVELRAQLTLFSARDFRAEVRLPEIRDTINMVWGEDSRSIYLRSEGPDLKAEAYRLVWYRYDLQDRGFEEVKGPQDKRSTLAAQILEQTGDRVSDVAFHGNTVIAVRQGIMSPPALVAYTIRDKGIAPGVVIDAVNARLSKVALGKASWIEVRRENADLARAGLILPVGYEPERRYPLVVIYYNQFNDATFSATPPFSSYAPQVFAANGYVVLLPRLPDGQWYFSPSDYDPNLARQPETIALNLKAMLDHLDRDGIIDPKRMGIMGWSYGGFCAPYVLTHYPAWFSAGAIGDSATHMPSSYWQWPDFGRRQEDRFFGGGPYGKFKKRWERTAPIHNLDRLNVPVLMEYSGLYHFGVELQRAIIEHGGCSELYLYPKEDHVFTRPSNRLASMQRHLEWFNFWLKNEEAIRPGSEEHYARWRKMKEEWSGGRKGKEGFGF